MKSFAHVCADKVINELRKRGKGVEADLDQNASKKRKTLKK